MAGVPGKSGGHNRLSVEEHRLRGTLRRDRHLSSVPTVVGSLSAADRRRILAGLSPEARRLAVQLLTEYAGWDPATLQALRSYVLSCARLETLQTDGTATDTRPLHREIRHNLALLKALNLEAAR